jgi:D-alanyl-D-alanine dipeptidase
VPDPATGTALSTYAPIAPSPLLWDGDDHEQHPDELAFWRLSRAETRILSSYEVAGLTDAHVYATYSRSDLARIVGSEETDIGYLHPAAAYAFERLKTAGEEAGFRFRLYSAWRAWDEQERAFEHFTKTGQNLNGTPVPNIAHPCNSKHTAALAVDLAVSPGSALHRWLIDNARLFGFYNTRFDEPWEWQFVGLP